MSRESSKTGRITALGLITWAWAFTAVVGGWCLVLVGLASMLASALPGANEQEIFEISAGILGAVLVIAISAICTAASRRQ